MIWAIQKDEQAEAIKALYESQVPESVFHAVLRAAVKTAAFLLPPFYEAYHPVLRSDRLSDQYMHFVPAHEEQGLHETVIYSHFLTLFDVDEVTIFAGMDDVTSHPVPR